MASLTKRIQGPYCVYFARDEADTSLLIDRLGSARTVEGKGRGGIALLRMGPVTLAVRKYVHGGLFRAITRDTFFSPRRALDELEITGYLRDRGFPVVEPFAAIVLNRLFTKRLYFLTLYREGAVDLLEFLALSGRMKRMRAIKRLAELFHGLASNGVRHPDLHLNNVLVTEGEELVFLDFDKSRRGKLEKKDVVRMFWRLNRYAEKMEKAGRVSFSMKEKVLFLRTYRKLSGYDVSEDMERKAGSKRFRSALGWFVERALYGK
jgi:hypothetical protein